MTEYFLCPIEDDSFQPDTLEKCALLFRRLAELTTELVWENEELADKTVWVAWEV